MGDLRLSGALAAGQTGLTRAHDNIRRDAAEIASEREAGIRPELAGLFAGMAQHLTELRAAAEVIETTDDLLNSLF